MFNTLSSYLFGSSTPQEEESGMEVTTTPPAEAQVMPCRLKETQADEEWILVDKSSKHLSPMTILGKKNEKSCNNFLLRDSNACRHMLLIPLGKQCYSFGWGSGTTQAEVIVFYHGLFFPLAQTIRLWHSYLLCVGPNCPLCTFS